MKKFISCMMDDDDQYPFISPERAQVIKDFFFNYAHDYYKHH